MVLARATLVGVFLIGQLGGLIHQATTVHSRCPEHGELVHGWAVEAPAPVGGLAAWAAESARGLSRPAEARELSGSSRHDHDHCFVTISSREGAAGAPACFAVADDQVSARGPEPLAPAAAPHTSRLYRTAPKTSPPA